MHLEGNGLIGGKGYHPGWGSLGGSWNFVAVLPSSRP